MKTKLIIACILFTVSNLAFAEEFKVTVSGPVAKELQEAEKKNPTIVKNLNCWDQEDIKITNCEFPGAITSAYSKHEYVNQGLPTIKIEGSFANSLIKSGYAGSAHGAKLIQCSDTAHARGTGTCKLILEP